jgi:hypothetical protein
MAGFTKNDLLYIERYEWNQVEIIEDFMMLDRNNGHQVLHFANSYAKKFFHTPLKGDLHKIEYMLAYRVPQDLENKTYIATFINSNW